MPYVDRCVWWFHGAILLVTVLTPSLEEEGLLVGRSQSRDGRLFEMSNYQAFKSAMDGDTLVFFVLLKRSLCATF